MAVQNFGTFFETRMRTLGWLKYDRSVIKTKEKQFVEMCKKSYISF